MGSFTSSSAEKQTRQTGMWKYLGRTAIAKVVVMGASGLLGIFTSRLIIQHFGVDAYAQYGLLTSLPALLPFADLGISAVVFNALAASDDPSRDTRVRNTITTAFRILLVSGPAIMIGGIVISLMGLWPSLLGNGLLEGGPTAAMLCAIVFGLVLPLSVGQRILVGLGRTGTQVASQIIIAPFILISVVLFVLFAVPASNFVSVLSYIGAGLVSAFCLILAARAIKPQVGAALRDIPRLRAVPNVPFLSIAGPVLVQMLILPLATQTDRLFISHLGHGDQLAQYNLGSQLFGIALQTVSAAGLALWPIYAKARASSRIQSPFKTSLAFLAAGLGLGGLMAAASPFIVAFLSDGKIKLDGLLILAFALLVAIQAAKYPLGMYMTDARGLKFQMIPILLMAPVNLSLSWFLVRSVGAAGPVLANTISALAFQIVPYFWYVRRDLARRRAVLAESVATKSGG